MSGAQLKIVAILIMIIDHVGAVIFPEVIVFRIVGRLAFPMFAFFIGEGLLHTRDSKRYGLRLLAFAVISEVPFDLCFYNKAIYLEHQNIFFTLALGVLSANLYQKYLTKSKNIGLLLVYVLGIVAEFLRFDYGMFGVILIFGIYQATSMKAKYAWVIGINVIMVLLSNGSSWFQMFGAFSVVFLMKYNHERGKGMKYLFYGIYPFHLFLLYMIKLFIL